MKRRNRRITLHPDGLATVLEVAAAVDKRADKTMQETGNVRDAVELRRVADRLRALLGGKAKVS